MLKWDTQGTTKGRAGKAEGSTARGEAASVLNPRTVMNILLWCLALSHTLTMTILIGFMWQDFGIRKAVDVIYVRRHQKFLPWWTETVSDISKMDLPLHKVDQSW